MIRVRIHFSESALIELISKTQNDVVMLELDGGEYACLISSDQYEGFLSTEEELEDLRAVEESMQDPGPNIPWEQVKKDLGF